MGLLSSTARARARSRSRKTAGRGAAVRTIVRRGDGFFPAHGSARRFPAMPLFRRDSLNLRFQRLRDSLPLFGKLFPSEQVLVGIEQGIMFGLPLVHKLSDSFLRRRAVDDVPRHGRRAPVSLFRREHFRFHAAFPPCGRAGELSDQSPAQFLSVHVIEAGKVDGRPAYRPARDIDLLALHLLPGFPCPCPALLQPVRVPRAPQPFRRLVLRRRYQPLDFLPPCALQFQRIEQPRRFLPHVGGFRPQFHFLFMGKHAVEHVPHFVGNALKQRSPVNAGRLDGTAQDS